MENYRDVHTNLVIKRKENYLLHDRLSFSVKSTILFYFVIMEEKFLAEFLSFTLQKFEAKYNSVVIDKVGFK